MDILMYSLILLVIGFVIASFLLYKYRSHQLRLAIVFSFVYGILSYVAGSAVYNSSKTLPLFMDVGAGLIVLFVWIPLVFLVSLLAYAIIYVLNKKKA